MIHYHSRTGTRQRNRKTWLTIRPFVAVAQLAEDLKKESVSEKKNKSATAAVRVYVDYSDLQDEDFEPDSEKHDLQLVRLRLCCILLYH